VTGGQNPAMSARGSVTPRSRRARRWIVSAVIGALFVSAGVATALIVGNSSSGPACAVTIGDQTYSLDREQAANALAITAVSSDLGMAHHAVTVAVAAALQESGLHDLTHGDRDSVGIFQQRPSQGWGTPTQLVQPRYAAQAFLSHLAGVYGWESLPVTVAAQAVQHSATPNAYAKWEAEARAIARATTREVPGALHCAAPISSALDAGAPGSSLVRGSLEVPLGGLRITERAARFRAGRARGR
jgi:hypothetical protein